MPTVVVSSTAKDTVASGDNSVAVAAALRSLVNSLLGSFTVQAADAQPVVQSGVLMEQMPALAGVGNPSSIATVQPLIPEMVRRFFEVETKGTDDHRDDFFSGYLAGMEEGVVGSLERLQLGKELASDVGTADGPFTFDSGDVATIPWTDDFLLP